MDIAKILIFGRALSSILSIISTLFSLNVNLGCSILLMFARGLSKDLAAERTKAFGSVWNASQVQFIVAMSVLGRLLHFFLRQVLLIRSWYS